MDKERNINIRKDKELQKNIVKAVILLLIAVLSIFVVSRYAGSPEFHKDTIASLDEKKDTVMGLMAASTASSAAITLLPGDTATPIADKLVDLSSYFLLVLSAIYLEKYLLTILGTAAFSFLIPIGCILYAIILFKKSDAWQALAKKLILFGLAMALVIPVSVMISDKIEETYQASIQNTIEAAEQATDEIEEDAEDEGFLSGIVSGIKDGVSNAVEKVESVLNNFIEALAIMIVTSCVIPIMVLAFMVWLVKIMLGVDINIPAKGLRMR